MRKIKNIIFTLYKLLFKFCGIVIPKNKNLIIFESFLGKQFSDNPRAIYEYIKENHPEYKMYWSLNREASKNILVQEIEFVTRFSLRWIYLMNRAKFWVSNSRLPLWIPKPRNTIYIQTWHGTPLKKLALDIEEVHMPGTNTELYKKNFISETKKWDYLISPNNYSTKIFKRAFKFDNIIESGYPRNDYLVINNSESKIINIKKKLNLPLDKKILLYAPTWRDNNYYERGRYKFEINLNLDLLQKNLSDEYIMLLRMHYLVSENLNLTEFDEFIYDFSQYDDIRDLYLISDLLITDYSSVFFDYAILERPMIFFVYDIEEYRDKLRGFYFNFENNAPGPFVNTTRDLLKEIKEIDRNFIFKDKVKMFKKEFCNLEDGNASKRVVNSIIMKEINY